MMGLVIGLAAFIVSIAGGTLIWRYQRDSLDRLRILLLWLGIAMSGVGIATVVILLSLIAHASW